MKQSILALRRWGDKGSLPWFPILIIGDYVNLYGGDYVNLYGGDYVNLYGGNYVNLYGGDYINLYGGGPVGLYIEVAVSYMRWFVRLIPWRGDGLALLSKL